MQPTAYPIRLEFLEQCWYSFNEIELGIGIHGEPGMERTELRSVDELVEIMAQPINSVRMAYSLSSVVGK